MTVLHRAAVAEPLLEIDTERWKVAVQGRAVALTRIEFLILSALHEADGRVLTRTGLADRVGTYDGSTRALDVHICRLRRKLADVGPRLITVRGVGWRLLP